MMTNHIVTCLFKDKIVKAQKNKMMGQSIIDQNQEIKERECFKLHMLVNLVKVTYTCRYT